MLKTGIIGCGQAARSRHLPVVEELDGLKLAWVCDLDETVAEEVEREYGVDHYLDPEAAIEETPDVVHVCSPPPTHADLTVDECDKMAAAAEEADRKLSVVHNNLFLAPSREVLSDVESGEFGEILGVTAHLGRERNPGESREWVKDLHGGAAGEHLPHPLYLVTHFLGDIDDVSLALKRNDEGEVIGADIQIVDENDAFGTVQYMREAPPMKKYSVYGTRKRADVDLFNYVNIENDTRDPSKASIVTDNLSGSFQLVGGTMMNLFQYGKYAITGSGDLVAPGHYTLIQRFRESMVNGSEVPITPQEGTKVVRILEEIESDSLRQ